MMKNSKAKKLIDNFVRGNKISLTFKNYAIGKAKRHICAKLEEIKSIKSHKCLKKSQKWLIKYLKDTILI
jgi:hypothetical protein